MGILLNVSFSTPNQLIAQVTPRALKPNLPMNTGERKATKLVIHVEDSIVKHRPLLYRYGINLGVRYSFGPQPVQKPNTPTIYDLVLFDGPKMNDTRLILQQNPKKQGDPLYKESILAPGLEKAALYKPEDFAGVVKWTFENYPSTIRYLEVRAHGAGAFGLFISPQWKDTKDYSGRLFMPQLRMALQAALHGSKIDILTLRACNMVSLEAMYELKIM